MLPKIPTVGEKTIRAKELSKWEASGWKFHKALGGSAYLIRKRYSAWEQFEMRTRALFLEAGFDHAISDIENFHFNDLGPQIDVCGGVGNYFVVIDCTQSTRQHPISIKQKLQDNHAKRGRIEKAIHQKWGTKYSKLVMGVCVEGVELTKKDEDWSRDLEIPILDSTFMEKCLRYVDTLGSTLRYQVLGRLGVRGIPVEGAKSGHFKFPAITLRSGDKVLYSFCADPESLLKIAYVYRLERFDDKGYQRDLIQQKLRQINNFLIGPGYFPNNLVVCFDADHGKVEFVDRSGKRLDDPPQGTLGYLRVPQQHSIAEIIDGQHRLYGYLDTDKNREKEDASRLARRRVEDRLNVVAIEDPGEEERPLLFVDINCNQSRVNVKSIWSLMGDIRPKSHVGFVANLVKALNGKGPLKGKIYIPGKNTAGGRSINIANLGKGIKDRALVSVGKKNEKLDWNLFDGTRSSGEYPSHPSADLINDFNIFFGALKSTCATDWKRQSGGFVLTNNGLNVMLRVLAQTLRVFHGHGKTYKKSTLKSFIGGEIGKYIESETPRTLRSRTLGEDGRSKTANGIWERIAKRNRLSVGSLKTA